MRTSHPGRKDETRPYTVIPLEVDDRHVYRFHDALEWANTIRVIREKFALRRDGPHLDIICRNEAEIDIVLHFKKQDVYLVGFSLGDAVYEFPPENGGDRVRELPGSIFLSYNSGYGDMGARSTMASINIGYQSFSHALLEMIKGTGLERDSRQNWLKDIRSLVPTVLVMLPECVRFKWHYLAVRRMMTGDVNQGVSHTVNDWMELGIKNWQRASVVAFGKEHTNRGNRPPSDEIHAYVLTDMERALRDWVWATDLLSVHCLVKREPRHVLQKVRMRVGQSNVNHLLILWNNKEVDWQTERQMKDDFPDFDTRVSFPTPPPAGGICLEAAS